MTAAKIRAGVLFEAQRNGDVQVEGKTVPHLDTIRLAYWLVRQYMKGAAKRTEGGR